MLCMNAFCGLDEILLRLKFNDRYLQSILKILCILYRVCVSVCVFYQITRVNELFQKLKTNRNPTE